MLPSDTFSNVEILKDAGDLQKCRKYTSEAMKEFDKEGIQKLGDLAEDNLKQVIQT